MKDKRKKKDRTWAEAARLVRTAPPAARRSPRAARGRRDGRPQPEPPPAPGSRSLLFRGSGLAGPPWVCVRADGRSDRLGDPAPAAPGTLPRTSPSALGGAALRGDFRAPGPPAPRPAARRPLCGRPHSRRPRPRPRHSINNSARAVGVRSREFMHFPRACTARVPRGLAGRVHAGSGAAGLCAVPCAFCVHTDPCMFCVDQVRLCV